MQLNARELGTVLAALRYWQTIQKQGGLCNAKNEYDPIASDNGLQEPLTAGEIDDLCERINVVGEDKTQQERNREHNHTGYRITDPSKRTQFNRCTICKDWFYPIGHQQQRTTVIAMQWSYDAGQYRYILCNPPANVERLTAKAPDVQIMMLTQALLPNAVKKILNLDENETLP